MHEFGDVCSVSVQIRRTCVRYTLLYTFLFTHALCTLKMIGVTIILYMCTCSFIAVYVGCFANASIFHFCPRTKVAFC